MFRDATVSPDRNGPSTTPAGPPPGRSLSFIPSSTPAGAPPPRLNFGNTRFNPSNPGIFNSSPPKNELTGLGSGLFGAPTSSRPNSQRGRSTGSFRVPSSPPDDEDDHEDAEGSEEAEDDMEDDAQGENEEEEEDEDIAEDNHEYDVRARGSHRLSQSMMSRNSLTDDVLGPTIVRTGAKQSQYDLTNMAKGLTSILERPSLREPDDVILETQQLLEKLHESLSSNAPERRSELLGDISRELLAVWEASADSTRDQSLVDAHELTSLLLSIHHPTPIARQEQQSALSLVARRLEPARYTPIPKVLLDWLNKFTPAISEVALVMRDHEGYSAHEAFWDAVLFSVARGNLADALKLLKGANFAVAETAAADGLGDDGYSGDHLYNTNQVVHAAIELLHECPAVASDDWDVRGPDWSIFRKRVQLAMKDLQEYAEGNSQNRHSISQNFEAHHFGLSQSQNDFNLSVASRKAESRVPWSIYENLSRLYRQLLGGEEDVLAVAGDWLEAVIGLTVWWNGDEEDIPQGSFAASRRSVTRSQRVRDVDVTPIKAYCDRLVASFAAVVESKEEEFGIDPTDRVEVALACVLDGNIEGALHIVRSWSLLVASAVGEVASAGDWFRRPGGILDQFDESDLMVLSYNDQQPRTGLSKDDLLIAYADQLASRDVLRSADNKVVREGWEMAVRVLERLDDHQRRDSRIETIFRDLKLDSSERVDKITRLCQSMGLSKHAQNIALSYAERLRNTTQNYGDTLLYYARAHETTKIQEVLRVLVALCLVKSIAYPPTAELDESLKALITSPKQTLTKLASLDSDAAHMLSNHLSGYATIRKFYDLRDEGILAADGEKPAHRPMARKRAAANALMVIISSAASSIRGGLYDPEVETVVQVDVLLPLLGEALLFVNQGKRTLTMEHLYSLLAAVEDLDTAPSMIRAQCEEVLSTTLAAAHNGRLSSFRSQMQKSTSNLTTASSQYSLIGSIDFGSVEGQSTDSSTVLVQGGTVDDAKRGWDWRKGFDKDAKGSDVIRVLRLGIAKEMARAFAEGDI